MLPICECGKCGPRPKSMSTYKKRALSRMVEDYKVIIGKTMLPNRVICPLCLTDMPFACMTRAHAPAKALIRSRYATWACCACNNKMSEFYEAVAIPFFKPRSSPKIYLANQSEDEAVECRFTPYTDQNGRPSVRWDTPLDESKIPAYKAMIDAIAKNSSVGIKLIYQAQKPPALSYLDGAIVSWFWFKMFSYLGYSSVQSPQVELIRLALLGNKPLPCRVFRGQDNTLPIDQLILWTDNPSPDGRPAGNFIGWGVAVPPYVQRAVGPNGRPQDDNRPFFVVWSLFDTGPMPNQLTPVLAFSPEKALQILSMSRTFNG